MIRVGFIIELTDVLPIGAPGQSSGAVGGVMFPMPGLTPMIEANRIRSTPSSRTIGEHRRRGQQDARHVVQQHANQHCGKNPCDGWPARAGSGGHVARLSFSVRSQSDAAEARYEELCQTEPSACTNADS